MSSSNPVSKEGLEEFERQYLAVAKSIQETEDEHTGSLFDSKWRPSILSLLMT